MSDDARRKALRVMNDVQRRNTFRDFLAEYKQASERRSRVGAVHGFNTQQVREITLQREALEEVLLELYDEQGKGQLQRLHEDVVESVRGFWRWISSPFRAKVV